MTNKDVAAFLRRLAWFVERSRLDDWKIEVNSITEFDFDMSGWAHYIQTGEMSIKVDLHLYSKDKDESGKILDEDDNGNT